MADASWVARARALPATAWQPRILLAAAAAAAAAVAPLSGFDDDVLGAALSELPWAALGTIVLLVGLCAVHFVSAAYGLQAVVGRRLGLQTTTYAQVAAAAANRVVPNGVGGLALNLRYLLKVGVSGGSASSVLTVLAIVAGVTDAAWVTAVSTVGPIVGLRGGPHEFTALAGRGVSAGQQWWFILAAPALVFVVVMVRRRRPTRRRLLAGAWDALRHARAVCLQPGRLCVAAATSTASTAAMSFGFVLSVHMWGTASAPLPAGALVAIYVVAATAGGTAPVPGFFALTELAMIAALVVSGYTATSSALAVVIFRAVTYWLPLPVGLWTAVRLRRARLL